LYPFRRHAIEPRRDGGVADWYGLFSFEDTVDAKALGYVLREPLKGDCQAICIQCRREESTRQLTGKVNSLLHVTNDLFCLCGVRCRSRRELFLQHLTGQRGAG